MGGSLELFLSSLLEFSHYDHKGLHEVVHLVKVQDDLQGHPICFFFLSPGFTESGPPSQGSRWPSRPSDLFFFFPFSFHQGLPKVVQPVKVQDDLELSSCFLYLHFLHLFPFSYHQGSHEPVDQVEVQDDLQDHDGRQEEGPDLHAVVQSGVRIGETSKEASGHRDSSHQPDHLQDWAY